MSASDSPHPESTIPIVLAPGERLTVGPYRILQKIAEGGMGEVYLAEQEKPVHRMVALKLIRAGMDTAEVVSRFELERQALALLNHPTIAIVYGAGTTEQGRPYFAMEYVPGLRINEYAERHRLSIAERLDLFVRVCDGVQYAHQKGLIHRDLKPTNILVAEQDGKPIPKIIDFGIAKATAMQLTEKSMHTMLGQVIGTPGYMSPEQVGGALDVDTRADVYALGVLLHELLVGVLPFDLLDVGSMGHEEFMRRVREDEAQRPSSRIATLEDSGTRLAASLRTDPASLAEYLRIDLDWIVLKALAKDRTRRYPSVSELAGDVRRHLRHEPVLASPPSGLYRMQKFVRRHRAAVFAAGAVSVALILGMIGTGVGLLRAVRAERQARMEAETASKVTSFMVDLFQVSDPGEARGNSVLAREILDLGAEKIRRGLEDQPLVKARLMDTMGQVYIGLGLYDKAAALLRDALKVRLEHLGPENGEVASSYLRLGQAYIKSGQYRDAEHQLIRSLAIRRRVLSPGAADVGFSAYWLSVAESRLGKFAESKSLLTEALQIFKKALGPEDIAVAWCVNDLANIDADLGHYGDALRGYEEAFRIKEKKLGGNHPDTIQGLNNIGDVLSQMGRLDEARVMLERAVAQAERVYGPNHPYLALDLVSLGELKARSHDSVGARKDYLRALRIQESSPAPDLRVLGLTLADLGAVDAQNGSLKLAVDEYRRALDVFERSGAANSLDAAQCLERYSKLLDELGRPGEASATRYRAATIRARAAAP